MPTKDKRGNGQNPFGVGYSTISFVEKVIRGAKGVSSFVRENDILFNISFETMAHKLGMPDSTYDVPIVISDAYRFSAALLTELHDAFPDVKVFALTGDWCKFTTEAESLAGMLGVKLLNSREFIGCLHRGVAKGYFEQ